MIEQLPLFDPPSTSATPRTPTEPIVRSAEIEDNYRWTARRAWGAGPCIHWNLLNPSDADALKDDPTMWRMIGFSYRWGFGSLVVTNLYPFISANQEAMRRWRAAWTGSDWHAIVEATGRGWEWDKSALNAWLHNMDVVRKVVTETEVHVAAWGNGADDEDVKNFIDEVLWTGKLALAPDGILHAPLHRKKRTTYFVNSMGDLFHEDAPDAWIDLVFAVMADTPHHTYQVLTKRADRMRAYLSNPDLEDRLTDLWRGDNPDRELWNVRLPLPNVWFGVSTERQQEADERIPLLLQTPAAVRFISAEPLLGPIDFSPWLNHNPVYEEQAKRGVRLSSSAERRSRDIAGRHDLARSKTDMGSLAEEGSQSPMQEGESGARLWGISASQDHAGRRSNIRAGAPPSMASLQGSDTDRPDGEPQIREEEKERAERLGTGDLFGTTNSRDSRLEGGARLQSGRPNEQHGQTDNQEGQTNPVPSVAGRAPSFNSGRLRDQFPASIKDSQGHPLGEISWIICGGESGPSRDVRPADLTWIRSIVQQCSASSVACFVKQLGSGTGFNFHDKKGGDPSEWAADLRVRQMPGVAR